MVASTKRLEIGVIEHVIQQDQPLSKLMLLLPWLATLLIYGESASTLALVYVSKT